MNRLNDVSIFSLQVFVLVYESLNSMAVAQALNVPASKVSRTLNQLRHSLGDPLFHRRQYGFEPSEMAVRIYPEMKRLLELARQACSLDVDERNRLKKEVVIAAPSALSVGLPQYLTEVAQRHGQECTFVLKPTTHHSEREIRQGEVDLCIAIERSTADGVHSDFVVEAAEVFVVGHEAHPVWTDGDGPLLNSILDYPFIVHGMPAFNDRIDPLEVYAREIGREVKVQARILGLTETIDQLLSSQALTFIGQRHTAELIKRFSGIRVEPLPQEQFTLLHQRMGQPCLYLLSSSRQCSFPPWLFSAVHEFFKGALGHSSHRGLAGICPVVAIEGGV